MRLLFLANNHFLDLIWPCRVYPCGARGQVKRDITPSHGSGLAISREDRLSGIQTFFSILDQDFQFLGVDVQLVENTVFQGCRVFRHNAVAELVLVGEKVGGRLVYTFVILA